MFVSTILMLPYTSHALTSITSWEDLANISLDLAGDYVLTTNLDSNSPGYATYVASSWTPIPFFTGTFDGNNHTISDLYISGATQAGLFDILGGTVTNLGLLDVDILTNNWAGGLAYYATGATISGVYVTGTLQSASNDIGGLVALVENGTSITNSYADVSIIADSSNYAGGLVGEISGSTISNSYASGVISGLPLATGGLVGKLDNSDIIDSYARVTTDGVLDSGGLVGEYTNGSTITNSYAAGAVTTVVTAGGLVSADPSGGVITNSFWDTQTTGQATSSGGGTGKTTLLMKDIDTFTTELGGGTWDFVTDWDINGTDNSGYPFLAWQVFPDTTAPIISETTPVTASGTDTTPDYTFTSDEAGDITYGGSCTSLTTTASVGANTITFETLALGTYTNCTITVTDAALNASNVLAVTAFTITAPASGGSSGSRATKKVVVAPGYPSSPTPKPTDCLPSYVFSPSTGILCPKEIPSKFVFLNNLQSGMIHSDVKELQKYLNTHGFPVALSGAGSLGNETEKFGALTKQALIKFQQAKGITPAVGYFGPITRGLINSN